MTSRPRFHTYVVSVYCFEVSHSKEKLLTLKIKASWQQKFCLFVHSLIHLMNEWLNKPINPSFLSRGLKLTHQRVLASHKASVSSQMLIKSSSYQDQCVFSSCIVWTQTRNSTIKRFVFRRYCKHSMKFSNQRSMLQRTLSLYKRELWTERETFRSWNSFRRGP